MLLPVQNGLTQIRKVFSTHPKTKDCLKRAERNEFAIGFVRHAVPGFEINPEVREPQRTIRHHHMQSGRMGRTSGKHLVGSSDGLVLIGNGLAKRQTHRIRCPAIGPTSIVTGTEGLHQCFFRNHACVTGPIRNRFEFRQRRIPQIA